MATTTNDDYPPIAALAIAADEDDNKVDILSFYVCFFL